jgi:hypothetical protein
MSWIITPTYDGLVSDPDANTYLAAVQAADGQLLEPNVRIAVNNFIVGCKADGIWSAIKASCILAGARTLAGALVPLTGTAPTNFNFVTGDYNRKTGLKGDGSTKYLDTNRNNNADPQNSKHYSVFMSQPNSFITSYPRILVAGSSANNDCHFVGGLSSGNSLVMSVNNTGTQVIPATGSSTGFMGASRSGSNSYVQRSLNASTIINAISGPPSNVNFGLFTVIGATGNRGDSRIAFYSIGESLDLALLDTRVTTLISDLAAAIP